MCFGDNNRLKFGQARFAPHKGRIISNMEDPEEVMGDENIEYLMAKLARVDSGFSTRTTDAQRSLSAFQHSAFADSAVAKPCAEIVHRCFHLFSALCVGIR